MAGYEYEVIIVEVFHHLWHVSLVAEEVLHNEGIRKPRTGDA